MQKQPQEAVRFIEFRGKYEIVIPAELDSLPDDELVRLIMERGEMDESRAREALAIIRGASREAVVYNRV